MLPSDMYALDVKLMKKLHEEKPQEVCPEPLMPYHDKAKRIPPIAGLALLPVQT